jgi:ElaB/YqjD/DUF883 family membrane-anchored ribosome-binding protein
MADTAAPAPKAKRAAAPKVKTKASSTTSSKRKVASSANTAQEAFTAAPIRNRITATTDTIRAEAQRKATEIGDEMGKLATQAGERARSVANQGKARAAEGLESLARVIDDSALQVDNKLGKQYGDFARSAAQTVAGLADTLDEKDLDELVAATRDFVRKSPAVAIGSAAVVGFMLARMLRSGKGD